MTARWVFAPVLGAPVVHAPVLTWDLLGPLKRPIDGGATLRGRRVLGENKTWRGALMMSAGTVTASVLLRRFDWYRRRLPAEVSAASPVLVGLLLGLAVVAGEFPNSFAKRQLDIPPGGRRRDAAGVAISIVDQADWVPTAWLLLSPVWRMSPRQAADVFALVAGIHVPINVIGYAIGARTSPV
jgi:CDP-2,3-bis-(O-geranylgeranyl)-sn-glycerol synthase